MVNSMLPVFGLLALASVSVAAPTASTAESTTIDARDNSISFQEWADTLIGHPDNHLTPEEAVAQATEFGTHSVARSENSLLKRDITCDQKESASVHDAVQCINQLAARGGEPCFVAYAGATNLCTYGKAQVVGVTNQQGGTTSTCEDVARSLGAIMDQCWRPDNTVQGQNQAWGNGNMAVHLSAPLI